MSDRTTEDQSAEQRSTGADPAILIVDDHPSNLLAIEAILAPLGHRLVRASSGEEALQHLLQEDFAVILLDVVMPGLDGFQTAAIVKAREKTRRIPVIFLSALHEDATDFVKGYAHGAVDYLVKPFEPEILRAKVEVFVELYCSREEIKRQSLVLLEKERERDALRMSFSQSQIARQNAETSAAIQRTLAESIPQQVWTATPDGALDYVNTVVLRYFNQTAEAVLGAGWQAVLHPDDLSSCVERWVKSLTTGVDYEIQFRLRRHDGVYRWHLGRAVPVRDSDGQIIRWFGTNTDIDEQRRAIRTRDDLLATVSHDLRSPLGAISLAATMLRRTFDHTEDGIKALKYTTTIERAANRMEQLIRDLLDIASIESGHLSVDLKPYAVHELVDEAVEAILPLAAAKPLQVKTELAAPQAPVHCDKGRVLQVLSNILGNAVKFTAPAGEISVTARAEDRFVSIAVSDTGPGIESAELPHVFDRFWQAKETARAGTGLGLAICKGIVEQHGGAIWVESQLGVGTTFFFTLPLASSARSAL